MNDTVVAIVSAFFVIGILFGIVAVLAMSVLRAERRGHRGHPRNYQPRRRGDQPPDGRWPDPRWDEDDPGDHSRWPEGSDSDFRGR